MFGLISYPTKDDIIGTEEHRKSCNECMELYKNFIGKTWENVIGYDELNGYLEHAMSFFTPTAWKYYLPAYLIQNIHHKLFNTIYFQPKIIALRREHIEGLTKVQCKAIVDYLFIAVQQNQNSLHEYSCNVQALKYWQSIYQNAH